MCQVIAFADHEIGKRIFRVQTGLFKDIHLLGMSFFGNGFRCFLQLVWKDEFNFIRRTKDFFHRYF